MKKRYLISVVCFLAPLVFMFFVGILDEDRSFSSSENRELSTSPTLSLSSYLDASFMQDFESYYTDQFPFRETFMSLSKRYNSIMYPNFLLSDDDVISLPPTNINPTTTQEGGDSPAPSTNSPTTDQVDTESLQGSMIYGGRIMEIFNVSDSTAQRYANVINALYAECGEPDTYVLIPPPAYTLYAPENHINEKTDFDQAMLVVSAALDGPQLIDLRETFDDRKDEALYFRTDHHWTARGAYYACNAFLQAAENMTLPALDTYQSGTRDGFLGSLYRAIMANQASALIEKNPDTLEYFYPFADAEVITYSSAAMIDPLEREVLYPDYNADTNLYCVYMGGDIALGKITTQTKNGKSILVVRDSYGHAFVPFLIDAYETIYIVEPRYFNRDTNPMELGSFFTEHDVDTLLFLGYPNMSVGGYWDTISYYLEPLLP